MASIKDKQAGQALPLALMALGAGSLIIGPLLGNVSTGVTALRTGGESLNRYYSAESGIEHAIWRLNYEPGFATSIESGSPVNYSITVNGMLVEIVISQTDLSFGGGGEGGDPPPQSDRIAVSSTVEPVTAPLGVETLFTFTIQIENTGTSSVALVEIGDDLPPVFVYEPGSSSGVDSNDPAINENELVWAFSSPRPRVESGELRTQAFQARATLDEGIYYNTAWVTASPDSIGIISTGPTALILPDGAYYDTESQAGGFTISSAVRINDGTIDVLSWDIQ